MAEKHAKSRNSQFGTSHDGRIFLKTKPNDVNAIINSKFFPALDQNMKSVLGYYLSKIVDNIFEDIQSGKDSHNLTMPQLHLILDVIEQFEREFELARETMPCLEPLTDVEIQPPGEARGFNNQQRSGQSMSARPQGRVQQISPVDNPQDIDFWSMRESGFHEGGGKTTTPPQPPPQPLNPPSYSLHPNKRGIDSSFKV